MTTVVFRLDESHVTGMGNPTGLASELGWFLGSEQSMPPRAYRVLAQGPFCAVAMCGLSVLGEIHYLRRMPGWYGAWAVAVVDRSRGSLTGAARRRGRPLLFPVEGNVPGVWLVFGAKPDPFAVAQGLAVSLASVCPGLEVPAGDRNWSSVRVKKGVRSVLVVHLMEKEGGQWRFLVAVVDDRLDTSVTDTLGQVARPYEATV